MTRYSHLLFRLYQTVDPSSITKIIEKLPKRDKEIGLVSISKASPTVELTPTKIMEILSITEKNNLVIKIQHTDDFTGQQALYFFQNEQILVKNGKPLYFNFVFGVYQNYPALKFGKH